MKKVGQSEVKSEVVLQEPPEQNEDAAPDKGGRNESEESTVESSGEQEEVEKQEAEDVEANAPTPPRGKKRRKKTGEVTEEELMPRPSIYPFGLAFAIVLLFFGIAWNPIVLGIGALLVIAIIIGWGLERR